jgi:hypothetical protein
MNEDASKTTLVRPEIESLQDLAGKKVNFNTQGTAAAYSGPLIFSSSAGHAARESVGAVAGALAKAQIELANPRSRSPRPSDLLPPRRRPQLPLILIQVG